MRSNSIVRTSAPCAILQVPGSMSQAVIRAFTGVVPRLNATPHYDPIALTFWLELLGAPDPKSAPEGLEPDVRRARLGQSLRNLIQARAREEPIVLWLEDLHWLDPASEAVLEMLIGHLLAPEATGTRALLLATARPEYRPAWATGSMHLALAPLADADASALLDDWLGPNPGLAPLRAHIEARVRGNPLFVEEIVRSLVERGALRGHRGAYRTANLEE